MNVDLDLMLAITKRQQPLFLWFCVRQDLERALTFMKPMPPIIWMPSSVTIHAASCSHVNNNNNKKKKMYKNINELIHRLLESWKISSKAWEISFLFSALQNREHECYERGVVLPQTINKCKHTEQRHFYENSWFRKGISTTHDVVCLKLCIFFHINSSSYRGKDLADGCFNLEFLSSAVHVPTDHVRHGLKTHTEEPTLILWHLANRRFQYLLRIIHWWEALTAVCKERYEIWVNALDQRLVSCQENRKSDCRLCIKLS